MINETINFQTVSTLTPPAAFTNVALDEDAAFDWMTQQVWLEWDAQPEATVYHVFAWDEHHVTDRVNLGAFAATGVGRQRVSRDADR